MVSNSMWPMTTMLDKVTLETDCILFKPVEGKKDH